MIHIYAYDNMYLYEIIEDYKFAKSEKEKAEIFDFFCSLIWSNDNKRRVYTKSIHYNVNKNLIQTDLGKVFDVWSKIEYKYYKPMTQYDDWCSLIRQKINNIYTRYFDREVILKKEYMDLLKTPKRLYYEWISGSEMNVDTVTKLIDDAMSDAENVKLAFQQEKMALSWVEYRKVVERFLSRCFENCKLINDYEDKTVASRLDFLTEDHFYVRYICRSLDGEIKKWQKKYYGLPQNSRKGYRRCKECGAIIERSGNRRTFCNNCANARERERKRSIAHKYRVAK